MFSKKIIKARLAIVLAATLLLASCQSRNQADKQSYNSADSANLKTLTKEVKEVVFPLPTLFETTKMLNDIGANYVPSSLNPVNKLDKYFKEKSKAINLGVYGTDLAYAAAYDQKQDIKFYSKAVKNLIDKLGININLNKMLTEEYKQKLNNKDTLTKVISNTFYDTYKYLNEKSNSDLAIVMVSGMWVEAMYIATHISEDTYHYSGLIKIIVKQKDSYTKLMSLLKAHDSDKDIKDIENKLLVLKPSFDKASKGLTENEYMTILKTIQSVRHTFVD